MSDAHSDASALRRARPSGNFEQTRSEGSRRKAVGILRSRIAEAADAARAHRRSQQGTMSAGTRAFASEIAKLASGLPPARLRRVTNHIETHLGEQLSVRRLAHLAGMSPSHFSVLFRRSLGISPYAYVLARRLARARILVDDRSLTLTKISCRFGFSSHAHFTTAFRKHFGMTPSACRARGGTARLRTGGGAANYRRFLKLCGGTHGIGDVIRNVRDRIARRSPPREP